MVTKYKIDAIPTEIDPQGEYTYRDPETGAAALMAPTREGDRLELLLGGLSFAAIARVMGLDLDALARLGGGATDPLTFDGQPIGGATPVPTLALTTAPTLGTIRADMVPLDVPYSEGLATRDPTGPVIVTVSFRFAPSITADQATWDQGVDWTSSLTATGDIIIMRVLYTADGVSRTEYVSTVVQDALAADPALVLQSDNTYRVENVTTDTAPFEIEVPPTYPGPYNVDPALFAGGPIPLTPPVIEATETGVGGVLSVNPDALVLSLDPDVTRTREWLNGTTVLSTGITHTIVSGNQDTDITVKDSASDANGSRFAVSAPFVIPPAVASGYSPLDIGAKLIAAYDPRDWSTLAANIDGTGAITDAGQAVKYIRDLGPRANHLSASAASNPGNAISAAGKLLWNSAGFVPAAPFTGVVAGMHIYIVLDNEADNDWLLLGADGNTARWLGGAKNTADPFQGSMTAGAYTSGSTVLTVETAADLHAAWNTSSGYVVAGARNITGQPGGYESMIMPLGSAVSGSTSQFAGAVRYILFVQDLTAAELTDPLAYLASIGAA